MADQTPDQIIRAVIKPGVPPDCSEVTALEIIAALQKAGYAITRADQPAGATPR